MNSFRKYFMLADDVIFLNHGSFGATPKPVFQVYQNWQRKLEQQPVAFLGRNLLSFLERARHELGRYLNAPGDDLVFVRNATQGVNIVAHSLDLGPGDEILTTNHEYGACENVWTEVCRQTGARIVRQSIPMPVPPEDEWLALLWQRVSDRTKLIFVSHLTSPTAQQFPVDALCQLAREQDIPCFIDGAHAPGQIPLDIQGLGAQFYTGNCHKWLMAPKGAGFLYVSPEWQPVIRPLVVSWGWGPRKGFESGLPFLDALQWQGTEDPSAYLAVPAAIDFQTQHDWPTVINDCRELLVEALEQIQLITGERTLYRGGEFSQMALALLPRLSDPAAFQTRLYDQFGIEVPVIEWEDFHGLRLSIQAYNSADDVQTLAAALKQLLPKYASPQTG